MSGLLYLFRHGIAAPPGVMIGQTDIGLSEQGKAQAGYWRDLLRREPFSAAYSSPLARARETAGIILSGNNLNPLFPSILHDMREISLGLWDGREKQWIHKRYPQEWALRGQDFLRVPPPQGENFLQLADRVLPAFHQLCATIRSRDQVLLVAHQAVNRIILATIMDIGFDALFSIAQPPAALTVIEVAVHGRRALVIEQRHAPKAF